VDRRAHTGNQEQIVRQVLTGNKKGALGIEVTVGFGREINRSKVAELK